MSLIMHNNSGRDMSTVEPYVHNFYSFAKKKLGFDPDASVHFVSDSENAKNPLGKTASYSPSTYKITIYIDGRHLKDILRSISHELVHHAQNCRGDFDVEFDAGEGYAQKDPHLRKMEKEAYLLGSGIYFRDWEDNYKQTQNMGDQIMSEWKKRETVFELNNNILLDVIKEAKKEGKKKKKEKKPKETKSKLKSLEAEVEVEFTEEKELEERSKKDIADRVKPHRRTRPLEEAEEGEHEKCPEACEKAHSGMTHEEWQEKEKTVKEESIEDVFSQRHQKLNELLMQKWFGKQDNG